MQETELHPQATRLLTPWPWGRFYGSLIAQVIGNCQRDCHGKSQGSIGRIVFRVFAGLDFSEEFVLKWLTIQFIRGYCFAHCPLRHPTHLVALLGRREGMETIPNWQGQTIEVARSKGGTIVVIDPFDNLVSTGVSPWPPPEIIQKLYQSRQIRAFDEASRERVTRTLGYYTDLQSLHSEDAITWSVFGTLAYADQGIRCAYVTSLFELLRIPSTPIQNANIWLWRRIPHPDTLVSGGPEIDFGIQTENVVVLGEAKWLSKIGEAQGKAKDKNQLILREEFFVKYGRKLLGTISNYVILGLSIQGGMVENRESSLGHDVIYHRDLTWGSVCGIEAHPLEDELRNYLGWKFRNSRIN
jgi:hypothetical protein